MNKMNAKDSSMKINAVDTTVNHPLTDDWIKTVCPYCGVGCGVEAKLNQEAAQITDRRNWCLT